MNTFILPGKNPSENLVCRVSFLDSLSVGETISSFTVSIYVFSGTDPTPFNILYGSPTTDATNTIAIFTLTAGVSGVTYIISITVIGTTGNIAIKEGYVSIVPTNPF